MFVLRFMRKISISCCDFTILVLFQMYHTEFMLIRTFYSNLIKVSRVIIIENAVFYPNLIKIPRITPIESRIRILLISSFEDLEEETDWGRVTNTILNFFNHNFQYFRIKVKHHLKPEKYCK